MPTPKRPADAERALEELGQLAQRIAVDRQRRDELILEATRRGASLRVVAEAAGISYGRVQQVVAAHPANT